MVRRFGDGKRSAGRRLKKSAERGPDDRLHRRERIKRTTPPLSYLGTARADAGLAISLQLENAIGYGRCNLVEFLLSHLSRLDPQPAGGGVSRTSSAAPSGKTADCLGRSTKPPQSHGVGLRAAAAWTIVSGVPAGLRPGAESGGVPLVALEAPRVAELLPAGLPGTELSGPQGTTPDAPPPYPGQLLLETSRTVSPTRIGGRNKVMPRSLLRRGHDSRRRK